VTIETLVYKILKRHFAQVPPASSGDTSAITLRRPRRAAPRRAAPLASSRDASAISTHEGPCAPARSTRAVPDARRAPDARRRSRATCSSST